MALQPAGSAGCGVAGWTGQTPWANTTGARISSVPIRLCIFILRSQPGLGGRLVKDRRIVGGESPHVSREFTACVLSVPHAWGYWAVAAVRYDATRHDAPLRARPARLALAEYRLLSREPA